MQFTLEIYATATNYKKNIKNPYFRSSRSFEVIDVCTNKSLSLLLVMISNISLLICNRFHAMRANSDKITPFRK